MSSRRVNVRLCAVSDSFIWDEERTQEDEGCQLEDNAGQIDTTLQHLRVPLALAMHEKSLTRLSDGWRHMHLELVG
jgi:hypothetical protein